MAENLQESNLPIFREWARHKRLHCYKNVFDRNSELAFLSANMQNLD